MAALESDRQMPSERAAKVMDEDSFLSRPEYQAFSLFRFRKHIYQEIDARPKRAARFERKKKKWRYPKHHEGHPRLQQNNNN